MSWLKPFLFLCHADLSQSQLENRPSFFLPLIKPRHGPLSASPPHSSYGSPPAKLFSFLSIFHWSTLSLPMQNHECRHSGEPAWYPKYHNSMYNIKGLFCSREALCLMSGSSDQAVSKPCYSVLHQERRWPHVTVPLHVLVS